MLPTCEGSGSAYGLGGLGGAPTGTGTVVSPTSLPGNWAMGTRIGSPASLVPPSVGLRGPGTGLVRGAAGSGADGPGLDHQRLASEGPDPVRLARAGGR